MGNVTSVHDAIPKLTIIHDQRLVVRLNELSRQALGLGVSERPVAIGKGSNTAIITNLLQPLPPFGGAMTYQRTDQACDKPPADSAEGGG